VAAISSLTGKRKILSDVSKVSIGDESSLAKTTLAFAVLALQQVASPLFPTKNFPCSSDFETLGNGFPCFCFSSDSWHGTGKLGITDLVARQKWRIFNWRPCSEIRPSPLERLLKSIGHAGEELQPASKA
jgi:hypothetical protein